MGSPAIGTADGANCPAADQRGVTRPLGNGCDIGAYEVDNVILFTRNDWQRHPALERLLPVTIGDFNVKDVSTARDVFDETNCGKRHNDAVGCLAGHLLVAKLNVANGSDGCIAHTIREADAPLVSIAYQGPSGGYTLTKAQRRTAIGLKNTLDSYNNGLGCPQFSD